MRSYGKIIVLMATVLLTVWYTAAAVAADPAEFKGDSATTFLAHFNEGIDADFAKGTAEHKAGNAGITSDGSGKFGEALICRQGMAVTSAGISAPFYQINFPVANNINLKQGTLEFWVNMNFTRKPTVDKPYGLYYMFDIPSNVLDENKNIVRLCLVVTESLVRKDSTETAQRFNLFFGEKDKYISVPVSWKQGEWHHVAVTWDGNTGALFLDGEARGTKPLSGGLFGGDAASLKGDFYIGGLFNAGNDRGPEGLVDELRISDTVRYGK